MLGWCSCFKEDTIMNNKFKHLSFSERASIEVALNKGLSFKQIAQDIGKDPTTISKEVRNNFNVVSSGAYGRPFNDCKVRFSCHATMLCKNASSSCKKKYCKFCSSTCSKFCDSYVKEVCPKLSKPPYVCNPCNSKRNCTLQKYFYSAESANNKYKQTLSESRSGINTCEQELLRINKLITPLVLNGNSFHAISVNHASELMISERTLYNYVESGVLDCKNLDLPRKVRYHITKAEKKVKVDKRCRIGRSYEDFLKFMEEHPGLPVVEIDSVEGKKGGKVLLTIHFTNSNLQLAFLRDANTSKSVTDIFNNIYSSLGSVNYKKIFPVILADNGSEFSDPTAIEFDSSGNRRCYLFYCDASAPYQKGSAENNHEFIRRIIPKSTSMDGFSQDQIALMMNHINSYPRKKFGDKTPYEIFKTFYGQDILKKLDVTPISPDNVILQPTLLK